LHFSDVAAASYGVIRPTLDVDEVAFLDFDVAEQLLPLALLDHFFELVLVCRIVAEYQIRALFRPKYIPAFGLAVRRTFHFLRILVIRMEDRKSTRLNSSHV